MKNDFLKYQAQTTPHPLSLEISKAEGVYIYDSEGKEYLDFIAGVSANSLGHSHPKVNQAIKDIAAEDGYTYIFDTSLGIILYADESTDLTEKVKSRLGIL